MSRRGPGRWKNHRPMTMDAFSWHGEMRYIFLLWFANKLSFFGPRLTQDYHLLRPQRVSISFDTMYWLSSWLSNSSEEAAKINDLERQLTESQRSNSELEAKVASHQVSLISRLKLSKKDLNICCSKRLNTIRLLNCSMTRLLFAIDSSGICFLQKSEQCRLSEQFVCIAELMCRALRRKRKPS